MLAKAEDRSSDGDSKPIRGSEKRKIEDWSFGSLQGTQKERDELIKKVRPLGLDADRLHRQRGYQRSAAQDPFALHSASGYAWIFR